MRPMALVRRVGLVVSSIALAGFASMGCASDSSIAPGSRLDTPWRRMSDLELMSKIAEADGRVFIGFKDPGEGAGVTESGVVLTSPESVAAGKALITSMGIEITTEYRGVPAVAAIMKPVLLSRIRHDALIEYVEPIFPSYRLGNVPR